MPKKLTKTIEFEPTEHFRIRTQVRASTLEGAGAGTFALEEAAKGRFLGMDFLPSAWLLDHREYPELPQEVRKFCWRHVEHLWFRGQPAERRGPCDYMNHSSEPNLLCHAGLYFAARDIHAGDELFVDYRFLWDPSWGLLEDAAGGAVRGFEWRRSLLESCRRLTELLQEAPTA